MSRTPAPIVRRRFLVSGQVQMVGFRAYAARLGVDLGLGGWVRNRPDGRLEALVQGPVPATDEFLAFLREGPPAARVETVEAFEEAPSGDLPRFSIDA